MRFLIYDKESDELFFTQWLNEENFDSKRMVVFDTKFGKRIVGVSETGFIYSDIEIDHL